ncbi:MAG: DUF2270 domain-containing protein [Anaerolineales bacterium]|nr:DUF2270 domain-containing protein [Anaerolineales bacterium]MDW8162077.1 DUF2270 domain-containing protein [Anaerolineales bacterium]
MDETTANEKNSPLQSPFEPAASSSETASEAVWTYRGYRLKASEFTTAMVHFFRAEIQRANVWRQRLDTTTNWAVITTGAAIALAFDPDGFHGVIILNTLLITLFLYIEARRYRYYELWSYRVRLMETDFYAAMLVPPFHPAPDWAESLAENLLHPDFPISVWEAVGRRLRRNYLWIYLILGVSWLAKLTMYPTMIQSWDELMQRAAIGSIPGIIVLTGGVLFYALIFLVSLVTAPLQQATGEVLPRYFEEARGVPLSRAASEDRKPWFRRSRRRKQLVALIITDQAEAIAEIILKEMRRGVTAMSGTGMYTGKEHRILLCALTVTEINQLKTSVRKVDQKAFVMVIPAQEILGKGFLPLEESPEDRKGG